MLRLKVVVVVVGLPTVVVVVPPVVTAVVTVTVEVEMTEPLLELSVVSCLRVAVETVVVVAPEAELLTVV